MATQNKSLLKKIDIRALTMVLVLVILWVAFTAATGGNFLTTRNLSNLLRQAAFTGIMGVGMTLVIVTGGIDLAAGMTMGFIGCMMAVCQVWWGLSTPVTIAIGLIIGLVIGTVEGALIAYTGIAPFIVTLGAQLIFRGGMLAVTGGQTIAPFQESYKFWGTQYVLPFAGWILAVIAILALLANELGKRRAKKRYGSLTESMTEMLVRWGVMSVIIVVAVWILNDFRGIPIPVLVMMLVVVIFTFISQKTTFGRSVYAIGGNIAAARYAGINVKKNLTLVYCLNGLLCAVAAVIYTARLNGGTSQAANGNYELDAIASAVIGGTSMTGGIGKVSGAILGAVIMMSIDNGMSMMNLDAYWQFMVKGVILVAAVWFDTQTQKRRK
ncbi:sugar ABC transporter permease [Intestinibacillus sp. Marseille-P6563]|uniref:sugar ABC transporter permease n=1 Tax=Intestinibacillus sp. Marseille-P6563 TaxID=2364792 RepID=UPI000F069F46|nr:sugar ABC transporter permease [Intestinibacillus sp. Marseille-P6563]